MSAAWQLKPLGVEGVSAPIDVGDDPVTLGREPSNTVALPESAYPDVSGHHVRVACEGGEVLVEDLASTHGTYVNGSRVEREVVGIGDVIMLTLDGPRFAVVSASSVSDTISIDRVSLRAPAKKSFGDSTITNLRGVLGLPSETQVSEMVAKRSRMTALWMLAAVALVAVGIGLWVSKAFETQDEKSTERIKAQVAEQFDTLAQDLNARLAHAETAVTEAQDTYREQRTGLLEQKKILEDRIEAIEAGGSAATADVEKLRGELSKATQAIEMYDPVDLEQRKLAEVGKVRTAVVFLEVSMFFKGEKSGERLYMSTDGLGRKKGNFRGEGKPYKQESSGSGICVSKDGWILTNAHVVRPEGADKPVNYRNKLTLLPDIEVAAVFSGDSTRYPARVVKVVTADKEDLALVKIEPFEGMPNSPEPDIDVGVPSPGTEVYLFGFPLGKIALQEGDRLIASTFKGILSRQVDQFLQVDAGVHPGNSGGPMTDSAGRLLGLVTQVQVSNDGRIAPTIGYVIPSSHLSKIWPPPPDIDAAAGD